ncbi:PAS domain S-box protein [Desulfolithobacter sp.]
MTRKYWQRLSVGKKMTAGLLVMLLLLLSLVIIGCFTFWYIRHAEQEISTSNEIVRLALEMDRSMEKARRLMDDFLIHYPAIGFSEAHVRYAQPAVRESARAIRTSGLLRTKLNRTDLTSEFNLYLSLARRFARTSIEVVELVTRLSVPDRGLEDRFQAIARQIDERVAGIEPLAKLHHEMILAAKDYLLTRKRPYMQSSFNVRRRLVDALGQVNGLDRDDRREIVHLLDRFKETADEILAIDLALKGKLRDFALQAETVAPVSVTLVNEAKQQVEQAERHIDRVYRAGVGLMAAIFSAGLVAALIIARVLQHSITGRIVRLTEAAAGLRQGNMDVDLPVEGMDEVGELARTFSLMAAQIQNHVDKLEEIISRRTAELAASETRFRSLVDSLRKVAVQGYDENRRVFFWNRTCEELYGYTAEEACGRQLEDLTIPEEIRDEVLGAIQDCLDNGTPIEPAEQTLKDQDGNPVPVYSTHVLLSNHSGQRELYRVDVDLRDLKKEEEKRRQTELVYRELFENSSSGVAVYEAVDDGADFVFLNFNRGGEQIEGVRREDVIGRRVTEVFPGVVEFGLLDVLREVWKTGRPRKHPVAWYQDDRLQGWRENMVYKLPSGEIVAVYDDLTKEKQEEAEKEALRRKLQQVKKMEAIALMAGGVAHDLNNILSGIVSYPELLLNQLPRDSELYAPLESIQRAGQRAAAVVDDLLTVARGAAGVRKVVDVNDLIREYFDSPEHRQIRERFPGVRFHVQLATKPLVISCSPVHVSKSLMNLVLNAAEAVDVTGSVVVSTGSRYVGGHEVDASLGEGEYVVIRVQDSGSGIAPEDRERIFEPFYTRKVMGKSGTGLGLAVVWNTVQDHGGSVVVESTDQGACFSLYFPASNENTAVRSDSVALEDLHGHGELILVVDDEEIQRDITRQMLQFLGYTVHVVPSGEEAVSWLRSRSAALVLLDMIMDPGINGRETFARILEIHPAQKAVIVSGFSQSEEVGKTQDMGAGMLLRKPFTLQELGLAIRQALNEG